MSSEWPTKKYRLTITDEETGQNILTEGEVDAAAIIVGRNTRPGLDTQKNMPVISGDTKNLFLGHALVRLTLASKLLKMASDQAYSDEGKEEIIDLIKTLTPFVKTNPHQHDQD